MFGIRDINSKKYKLVNRLAESAINQNNNNENTPATDSPELEPKPKKEWIWVKGYKGFNEQWINGKLELTGRNNFVYNQDGETSIKENEDENELSICVSGLHFCLKLEDVFGFYPPVFNRIISNYNGYNYSAYGTVVGFFNTVFAEVEAEVEKEYYEKYKYDEKLVARKIRITRILSNEEIFEHLDGKLSCDNFHIETLEEFNYIKNALHEYTVNNPAIVENNSLALGRYIGGVAKELIKKKNINGVNILIEHGYSPTFAKIIMDKYSDAFEDAIAYVDEGLSPDMRAYLIVNSQRNNK